LNYWFTKCTKRTTDSLSVLKEVWQCAYFNERGINKDLYNSKTDNQINKQLRSLSEHELNFKNKSEIVLNEGTVLTHTTNFKHMKL